jgi:hypothetical protein
MRERCWVERHNGGRERIGGERIGGKTRGRTVGIGGRTRGRKKKISVY